MSRRHNREKVKEVKLKFCPKCSTEKEVCEFGRDASRSDGRYTYCKSCRRNPNRKDRLVLELAAKGLKACTLCQKIKPFSAFDKDSQKSLGVTSRCKKCHAEQRRAKAAAWHRNKKEMADLEASDKTRCYKCKETKALDKFLKNNNYPGGYSRLCLECNSKTRRQYNLMRRKALRDYTKWEVFEDDDFTCYLCEDVLSPDTPPNTAKSLSIDHVVPVSRGGLDERSNVRTACLDCNRKKNNTMLEDYLLRIDN